MKKSIFLFLLFLYGQMAFAGVVTETQARQRAMEFFASKEAANKTATGRARASAGDPKDLKLVWTFPDMKTKSSSEPALFVFERENGGYAIMAGEDVARPVLGFSLGARFPVTDMPDNMREMLQWYADIIEFARSQHWESPAATLDQTPSSRKLLYTAMWSQGAPFNKYTPEIDGEKTPTGCGATAISIIMRYHGWPSQGKEVIPGYDFRFGANTYHIDDVPPDHTYDWEHMPIHYEFSKYTDEEGDRIARLMYDVGVMCRMRYQSDGSSTSTQYATGLATYFDYDKQIRLLYRYNYPLSDEAWEQLVIDEINANRPVLYSAYQMDGHAFVIDGYFDRYFSINWGWGGSTTYYKGYQNPSQEWRTPTGGWTYYYTLTPIEGHETELTPFHSGQDMVTHIMPNKGGSGDPYFYCPKDYVTFLHPYFQRNKTFRLLTQLQTGEVTQTTKDFRYALFDKTGKLKEVISPIETKTMGYQMTLNMYGCSITQPLADGDKIILQISDPGADEWKPVIANRINQIVFTSKPLSELIEIGYAEPAGSGQNKDIQVKFYKDICWDLLDSSGTTFFDPKNGYQSNFSVGSSSTVTLDLLDPDDLDCDTVIFKLAIPSGSYTLRAMNPVTGEEMQINLEL